MKRFLYVFGAGGAIGSLLVNYFGVRFLAWYFEPPANIGVSCRPAVEWVLPRFQLLQLAGLLGGGALFTIFFYTVFRRRDENLLPPEQVPPA